MDKKGAFMIKKGIFISLLLVFIIMLSGCETVKGTVQGAAQGFQKDWQAAKKVDDWMRQNLW